MTSYAVELKDVSFTYWNSEEESLKSLNLQIPKGQFVVITGPTGAGKSTFLQLLNGLIPHQIPGRLKGEVLVEGYNTRHSSVAELAQHVGLVFEDPDTQIVSLAVEDDIAFGPSNLGLPPSEIRARIVEALEKTRLSGFEQRNPFTLSGGEKQSLAIAGILAMRPSILVLDEPTSMLDPIGRSRIVAILKDLSTDIGTTIIVAEQNPELILEFADRVLLFDHGQIVLDGTPREVFTNIPVLTDIGVKIPPMVETFWELSKLGLWNGAYPLTITEAAHLLEQKIKGAPLKMPSSTSHQASQKETIVDVRSVEHVYEGELKALRGVNVQFQRGELTAIIGQNGSGKSTLSLHLVGILRPTNPQGRIFVAGHDVLNIPVKKLMRYINYVFQNPDEQLFMETVYAELEYGLVNMDLCADEWQPRLEESLTLFGLNEFANLPPKSLRRGLRTKVAIASIVAMQPEVLIIDEPTTGLDRRESLEILRVLEALVNNGSTVIIITHEMDLVAQFARRVIVMHGGEILMEGTPSEIFNQPNELHKASLLPPEIFLLASRLGWMPGNNLRNPADLAMMISQVI